MISRFTFRDYSMLILLDQASASFTTLCFHYPDEVVLAMTCRGKKKTTICSTTHLVWLVGTIKIWLFLDLFSFCWAQPLNSCKMFHHTRSTFPYMEYFSSLVSPLMCDRQVQYGWRVWRQVCTTFLPSHIGVVYPKQGIKQHLLYINCAGDFIITIIILWVATEFCITENYFQTQLHVNYSEFWIFEDIQFDEKHFKLTHYYYENSFVFPMKFILAVLLSSPLCIILNQPCPWSILGADVFICCLLRLFRF